MIPATSLLPAATIPTPPRVVLIRVSTHSVRGDKHAEPFWHILGDLRHYEITQRFMYLTDVALGKQTDGSYLLNVADLGLDPDECMAYYDAEERYSDLCLEEDRFDLHSDPDGECLCGQIAEAKAITDKYDPKITAAVLEHFDAWTRRRHLVALGVALGFPDFDRPAWLERLGLAGPSEPEVEAQETPAVPEATAPYPVATDWTI
jgi:hypothetical protein